MTYRPSLESVRDRTDTALNTVGLLGDVIRLGGFRHRFLTTLLARIDEELCQQAEAIGELA